ncbi:uncharacterized protein LOC143351839 isoform X4 [Colletes latitarsis]|uniref:uncharacterized protein LOC143351839 isoform X4 n=1 Tax=Colletes latitarsis TaxID=2605962 RepID=UPI0040367659
MASEAYKCLRTLSLFLLVTALSAIPTPERTTVAEGIDTEDTTLSTELKPPPLPENEHQYVLFVINVYGVKNASGETSNEMLDNEITNKINSLEEPLATVFLLIEVDEDETETNEPVNLDEVATDLETHEGFKVEKIEHAGETKILKVHLDKDAFDNMLPGEPKVDMLKKVRNKRTPCLKCLLGYHGGGGGGGGGYYGGSYPSGGGCGGGGCGGGSYPGGTRLIDYGALPPGGCSGGRCGGGYSTGGGGGGHRIDNGGFYPGGGGGGGGGGHYPGGGGGGGHRIDNGGIYPGSGCSGGRCGGGNKQQTVGVIPIVVVPVAVAYPAYHPSGGGCSTCGNGGGGGSYAQASASAGSWGK